MASDLKSLHAGGLAVVVHAFYPDVFEGILETCQDVPPISKFYITTTHEVAPAIQRIISKSHNEFTLEIFENRGRDILPFFRIYKKVKDDGFEYLLKLHTKKSPQFKGRQEWQRDLSRKLIAPEALLRSWEAINADPNLGLLCPYGYHLPLSGHMGRNEQRVLLIGQRLGLSPAEIMQQGFIAGSMFMARLKALDPLLTLPFSSADFEDEAGQVDGTLAHALERCIGFGPLLAGQRISFTSSPGEPAAFNSNREFAQARWPKTGPWSWPLLQNLRYAGRNLESSLRHLVRSVFR